MMPRVCLVDFSNFTPLSFFCQNMVNHPLNFRLNFNFLSQYIPRFFQLTFPTIYDFTLAADEAIMFVYAD